MERDLLKGGLSDVDVYAVDFNTVIGADEDIFDSVNYFRADQIAAVAADLDGNIGGLDLELLVGKIDGADLRFLSECFIEALFERLNAFLGHVT